MEENHIQLTKEKYDGLSVDKLDDLINRRKRHYTIINSALETAKKEHELLGWLSDKLAYWSHHDNSELDEEYNYSELLNKIYFALETAKKEHELLGLYKEKDKYPDDSNQRRDIFIKITKLERELNEP